MSGLTSRSAEIDLLEKLYASFNGRDIETVLSHLHPDVNWPNGWEGGRIHGKGGVRDYWKRQFEVLNPRVEPQGFSDEDGRIAVQVHQVVRDASGNLLADQVIHHVYEFRDGLVVRMEIQP